MNIDLSAIRTISRDPSYHGWPTVARRRNGELLLVCSGGREEHICPYGKVFLMRSPDGGQTWSAPATLVDGPLDDRDAGILETRSGALLLNWFTSAHWMDMLYRQETGVIDWLAPETRIAWRERRDHFVRHCRPRDELGDWMIRSEDGGRTWSARVPTLVSAPHGPIELSDGRLLYAGKRTTPPEQWKKGNTHLDGPIGVAQSLDDGRTWTLVDGVSLDEGCEPHIVETLSGRLVMHIRNHAEPHVGETLQCESEDGGRTWTRPHSVGIWGTPAHLARLSDGRLLTTYGHRREPFGNRARFSDDEGRTWSEPVILSDDGGGVDLGYPSTVELADGSLVTVWYELVAANPRAVLRQRQWHTGCKA